MELTHNSNNFNVSQTKRNIFIPKSIVNLDDLESPSSIKMSLTQDNPSLVSSENMSVPDEYDEVTYNKQKEMFHDQETNDITNNSFQQKKQGKIDSDYFYIDKSCLEYDTDYNQQFLQQYELQDSQCFDQDLKLIMKSQTMNQFVPQKTNVQKAICLRYNVRLEDIIQEEENETQVSVKSPSLLESPKKNKVIVNKQHIQKQKVSQIKEYMTNISLQKSVGKDFSSKKRSVDSVSLNKTKVNESQSNNSLFQQKRKSALNKTGFQNSYSEKKKAGLSQVASPILRTPLMSPQQSKISRYSSTQCSRGDIKQIKSKEKSPNNNGQNKKQPWFMKMITQTLNKSKVYDYKEQNQKENTPSQVSKFNSSSKDKLKNAVNLDKSQINYFKKQRRSFECQKKEAFDISFKNSYFCLQKQKSPKTYYDLHQEEQYNKVFISNYQTNLVKQQIKRKVRDKFFQSHLKDELQDLSNSMDLNSIRVNNSANIKISPTREKKLQQLQGNLDLNTTFLNNTQQSFTGTQTSETQQRFNNLFLNKRSSYENSKLAQQFKQRMISHNTSTG